MANDEKTDKPGQSGSDDPAVRQPGEVGADRPLTGEVPADAPAAMNETSMGPSATIGDEAPEPRRDNAFDGAPLRHDPPRSDTYAESDDDVAHRAADRAAPPPTASTVGKSGGAGRGFVGGIVGSLLVLGAAGAGAYVTRDQWAPPVANMIAGQAPQAGGQAEERVRVTELINTLKSENADVRSQVSSVGTRLQSLQQEIDSLKQQSEKIAASAAAASAAAADRPAPDIAQPLEDINQRLSQVEVGSGRLSALERRLGDVQTTLSNIQATVDKNADQASRPAAAVLAINQLADALGRGGGYGAELELVRAIAAGDDSEMASAVGTLEQWSESGVSTPGEIRATFPAMAQAVAQTQFQSEGGSWYDDVRNRLSALVTVRRVGDNALAGGGVDAALAQADAALERGDLAGSVKAIESLKGTAADAAADWLAKARDRLAADKALASLRTAAIAKLNAAQG